MLQTDIFGRDLGHVRRMSSMSRMRMQDYGTRTAGTLASCSDIINVQRCVEEESRVMTSIRDHLEVSLNDPSFRAEWEAQNIEREVMSSIGEARLAAGLSQKEIAERCGMRVSDTYTSVAERTGFVS